MASPWLDGRLVLKLLPIVFLILIHSSVEATRGTHSKNNLDCEWKEDLCNEARPLFINPQMKVGPFSTLYAPLPPKIGKHNPALMRVPNGQKVVLACSGKRNSLVRRRRKTYAELECREGTFYENNAKVDDLKTPLSESCHSKQVVTFEEHENNGELKTFDLSMLVIASNNEVYFKVRVLDGVFDQNWNVLLTRMTMTKDIKRAVCVGKRYEGFFHAYGKQDLIDISSTYGKNWYTHVMSSTCLPSAVKKLRSSDVLYKMFGTSTVPVADSEKYLSRGHLSASNDFPFKYQQDATSSMLNVAPQWQSFNLAWNTEVEEKTQSMAANTEKGLVVLTGTLGTLKLPLDCGWTGKSRDRSINRMVINTDKNNNILVKDITIYKNNYRVPEIYWKLTYPVGAEGDVMQEGTVKIGFNTLHTSGQLEKENQLYQLLNGYCKKMVNKEVAIFDCSVGNFFLSVDADCEPLQLPQKLMKLLEGN
ncbi:uncharacterized protein LOC132198666 [Neocloeon triangulifer]|uniref:uncharacterized protein LOC132198666 n=1 Tax=Neocloeon triangulifer TaxID=2078957 RepID=UPI00286EEC9E|nr:uncharacterized protein LOC132198666 [Neocloeon triangulifer]